MTKDFLLYERKRKYKTFIEEERVRKIDWALEFKITLFSYSLPYPHPIFTFQSPIENRFNRFPVESGGLSGSKRIHDHNIQNLRKYKRETLLQSCSQRIHY